MRTPKSENPDRSLALEMSVNDLFDALDAALGDDPDNDGDEDYPWVVDVNLDDSTFIYCCDGTYREQGYSVENGVVSLAGVERHVQSRSSALFDRQRQVFEADPLATASGRRESRTT